MAPAPAPTRGQDLNDNQSRGEAVASVSAATVDSSWRLVSAGDAERAAGQGSGTTAGGDGGHVGCTALGPSRAGKDCGVGTAGAAKKGWGARTASGVGAAGLGSEAREEPVTDFGNATSDADAFGAAAVTLEDVAVAAYNGQAANLTKGALQAAATIISVDARHAAWARSIIGEPPAADAVDAPLTADEATARLDETGFLQEEQR